MLKTEKETLFATFKDIMSRDIRGVQIGLYTVATVGLGLAVYKSRPFTKLTNPRNLPQLFIDSHLSQHGRVLRVEPNSFPVLKINHKPLLQIPFLHSNKSELPVKISGVTLSSNGISWLQTIVVGNDIEFVPLSSDSNYVNCIVTMTEKPQPNPKFKPEKLNIGECLVKIGFASVTDIDPLLSNNALYNKYRKSLLTAEQRAKNNALGMWDSLPKSQRRLSFIFTYIFSLLRRLLPIKPKLIQNQAIK